MQDPTRMVLMAIIAAIIAFIILIIYFKFFAKKKTNYLFLILLVSIPPIVSIFRPGSYESGDLSLHTMRTTSFYNILFNEHLIPRWLPEFNVGYGDPYFQFAYFLPYFIGAILHFVGFTFLDSIKLLLLFSFILSGVTMYLWAKDELGEKAGFVSALFYLFAPYHLVDLHFRVSIAETLSFVFLPLLLLLTKKLFQKPTIKLILAFAFSYGLLILTHQVTTLIFSPILVAYALFIWIQKKKRSYKDLIIYALAIIYGFLLTMFYWLPVITEAKYTQANLSQNIASFTPLNELLYAPWRFGLLFQGHFGELSFLIGYTQLFIIFAAIYLLIKKNFDKKLKPLLFFFLTLFFILVFMITPQSKELWGILPFFKYSQFSYRLSEFLVLCTSIIAGIVVSKWKKNSWIVLLCLITALYTILNWGNRKALPDVQDAYLIKEFARQPDIQIYLEPSSPIWADLKKSKVRIKPKGHIEILSGTAEIQTLSRTSIDHKYIINSPSGVTIKENTLYFPGWTLLVNGKQKAIYYTNPAYPGIVTFSLPKGLYEVELTFQNTKDRSISLLVSILSFFLALIALCFSFIRKYIPVSFLSNDTNISSVKRKRKIS